MISLTKKEIVLEQRTDNFICARLRQIGGISEREIKEGCEFNPNWRLIEPYGYLVHPKITIARHSQFRSYVERNGGRS